MKLNQSLKTYPCDIPFSPVCHNVPVSGWSCGQSRARAGVPERVGGSSDLAGTCRWPTAHQAFLSGHRGAAKGRQRAAN